MSEFLERHAYRAVWVTTCMVAALVAKAFFG